MTIQDDINRTFREFKRYTGDGLPGAPANAPLPVGDPQSGVHNPKKADIRGALITALESVGPGTTYRGTWNASTNTPTIPAASSGNAGWFYYVSVAGSTAIDGNSTWTVGDRLISNGAVWTRVPADSALAEDLAASRNSVYAATARQWASRQAVPDVGGINAIAIPELALPSYVNFFRNSPKTVVGRDGLLRTVPPYDVAHDYHPTTGEYLGWLIEPGITNGLRQSQDFGSSIWGKTGVTVTVDDAAAPDGTMTADMIVEAAAVGQHRVDQSVAAAGGIENLCTFSVWVKSISGSRNVRLLLAQDGQVGNSVYVIVDLASGQVIEFGSGGLGEFLNARVQRYNGGWFRIAVVGRPNANGGDAVSARINLVDGTSTSYLGDGSSLAVWGAQFEEIGIPTSYIPTADSPASRVSDSLEVDALAGVANADEGTLLVHVSSPGQPVNSRYFLSLDTDGANALALGHMPNGHPIFYTAVASEVEQITWPVTIAPDRDYAMAASWGRGLGAAFAVNGSAAIADPDVGVPDFTHLRIGRRGESSTRMVGHVKQFALFGRRMSDTQLSAITSLSIEARNSDAANANPPEPSLPASAVAALNAWDPEPPEDMSDPFLFSVDSATYGTRTSHLAASVATIGRRTWVVFYGSHTVQADLGHGGFLVLMYCDDIDEGQWHEVLYVVPPNPSTQSVRDPHLAVLPDGRLLVMYFSNQGGGTRRGSYGFIIANPSATDGAFEVGRQYFLDYGLAGQVSCAGTEVRLSVDEWMSGAGPFTNGEGKHYSRIITSGRDGVEIERISDIPYDSPELNDFDETSVVPLSAGRTRAWWRTEDGIRTAISDIGDQTWSTTSEWTAFPTPKSRASFNRSRSGLLVAAFNNHPSQRYSLTLALSEDEGETWPWTVTLESRTANRVTYPSLAFDSAGNILVAADFGRRDDDTLGKSVILYRIPERLVRSGAASESDVEKFVIAT